MNLVMKKDFQGVDTLMGRMHLEAYLARNIYSA